MWYVIYSGPDVLPEDGEVYQSADSRLDAEAACRWLMESVPGSYASVMTAEEAEEAGL